MTKISPAKSIGAELRNAAREAPDGVAWLHGESATTFGEQWAEVREAAAALVSKGVRLGDLVIVWAANDRPTAVALLAAATAGATIVPINTRYTAAEVEHIIGRTHPVLVMAPAEAGGRAIAEEALRIAGDAPVVCLGPVAPSGTLPWTALMAGVDSISLATIDARVDSMTGEEVAIIQFTSGTTGRPKGVRLRQGPLLRTSAAWADVAGLHRGDTYPVVYPLAHIGGFKTGLITTLVARATAILVPIVRAESIVEIMNRHRVTFFNGPPAVLRTLLDERDAGKLPLANTLRTVVMGSAIVPPQLVRDLRTTLGVEDVMISYGLTEATGVCLMTRRGDSVDLVSESLGCALPGVDVRTDGATADEPRPIEVRGDNVMLGYLDDPEATAAAVRDGWLDTGDTGWTDEHGYVHIAGRSTDMLLVGGFNVYPAEVENALAEHADISQAAVVGLEHERLGEVPVAFIVARAGATLTVDDVITHARSRLANYKVPREIRILPELPRGHVGKIDRAALRARASELQAES
ncbi:AMP-binding protein [Microbacterium sp. A84]|uniref:AMP-binding protein n=1 Tax=Microbacterium sp. A84 TaxID=3450715 RepID=UPI003F420106